MTSTFNKETQDIPGDYVALADDGSESSLASESESNSSESDSEGEITEEYLQSLLDKARRCTREARGTQKTRNEEQREEDIIKVGEEGDKLPSLDPGKLPPPYLELSEVRHAGPSSIRDPDVASVEAASSTLAVPAAPQDPEASWRHLTKRQRKAMKNRTAGPGWFDLPAPSEADLPRLSREVEALRLRNQLDPKRFYRKDPGEGQGTKGLPKHFAIGTILPSNTPFGTASTDNIPRAQRKRALVDELVDDAETRRYAKKKFGDLQETRGARGRNTLHKKSALRKRKW
ncbi:Fcf2 pre-rRNA processing-domain-containing protein, partial [Phlebopus sp. FC_14]